LEAGNSAAIEQVYENAGFKENILSEKMPNTGAVRFR